MARQFVGVPSAYPKLLEIRKSKTADFKNNKFLKETTKLRYYQVVGSLHLMLLNRMILGDETGLGKCVSEDTYIMTGKGLNQIKDFVTSEMEPDTFIPLDNTEVLSLEGMSEPSLLYYSGERMGLNITTHNGYELSGLSHHPVLCPGDSNAVYKRLDELKKGDYVCINRKGLFSDTDYCIDFNHESVQSYKYTIPDYLDEDLAELLGYYVSEGNCPEKWTLHITQHYDEIRNRIRLLLKNIFGYEETGNNKTYDLNVIINSLQIKELFNYLGVNTEGKSGGQVIPHSVLKSRKSVIASFLRGYFEGDGSVEVSNKIVSCSSKSEELIKQLQILLLSFGIICRRKKKLVKTQKGRKPYWILYLCGKDIDLFNKEIGFVSERKQESLKTLIIKRNTNNDIIPNGSSLISHAMLDVIRHLRELPDQKNFSIKGSGWKGLVGYNYKKKIEAYIYKRRRLTYEGLKEFIAVLNEHNLTSIVSNYNLLKDVYDKNIFFDSVKDINPKQSKFYDFHVPETHNFTGNGFINHNTLEGIAAYTFLLERNPDLKLIVICPKSATFQWQEEFEKFTQGISTRVITLKYGKLEGFAARKQQYEDFSENVLIMNYAPVVKEYEMIRQILEPHYMMIADECVAFKNYKTQTHIACKAVAEGAERAYGFSATIIKNGLEEVWGIFDVIVPGLFGRITHFRTAYCKQKLIELRINGKNRKIPKTIGYKNLDQFKKVLDPYFLIRRKAEVATELPKLISKKIVLEMDIQQKELYREALSGILYEDRLRNEYFEICDEIRNGAMGEKIEKRHSELKEKYEKYLSPEGKKRGKLAALTYCQMVSNGPGLLNEPGTSSKEEEFIRLMKDELLDEKVIVFTRFKKGLHFLEIRCERCGFNYVKITGDEDDQQRKSARLRFQEDPNCKIIFITTAGSASLNLQAASVVLFYDTPWSYGDLVQTIGRAQRIGSIREHILLIHLINRGTIDVRVISKVTDKKDLSDQIIGDTAEGALDFVQTDDRVVDMLYQELLEDAKEVA